MSSTAKKNKKTAPTLVPQPAADGQGVQLSEDDGATIRSAEAEIMEQHRQLGVLTEGFRADEVVLLKRIGEARNRYQAVLRTLAQKHGIDLSKERWVFDAKTMSFTKAPTVQ